MLSICQASLHDLWLRRLEKIEAKKVAYEEARRKEKEDEEKLERRLREQQERMRVEYEEDDRKRRIKEEEVDHISEHICSIDK